jgi:hypothetical protein
VSVFDPAGRQVFSRPFNGASISTSLLQPGFYFIEISNGLQTGFARFVKE